MAELRILSGWRTSGQRMKRQWIQKILAVSVGYVSCVFLEAQGQPLGAATSSPAYTFSSVFTVRQWTVAEGLPASRVQCLRQTRDGYLWVGTAQGLARFDGVRFKVFKGIDVYCLAEDLAGVLWVGTSGGLYRFTHGQVERVPTPPQFSGDWSKRVFAMCPRRAGGIWACVGDVLAIIDDFDLEIVPQIAFPGVTCLLEDVSGKVWGGSAGFPPIFRRWDPATRRMNDMAESIRPNAPHIGAILEKSPSLLLVAGDTFLDEMLTEGSKISISSVISGQNLSTACALIKEAGGVVWLGRMDGLWRSEGRSFSPVRTDEKTALNEISTLEANAEGGVWAGTDHDGLFLLTPKKIHTLTATEGLLWDDAWSVTESLDGSVWIATGLGIGRLNRGLWESYGRASGLPATRAKSVVEDRDGRIWVGMEEDGAPGGVSYFENGRFKTLGAKDGFTSADVSSLAPDPDGGVWISGGAGVTLWREGRLTPPKLLMGHGILFVDRNKDLWSAGALVWHRRGGEWTEVSQAGPNILGPGLHAVVKHDEGGAYWLVSETQGVVRYKNGQFRAITSKNGLFSNLTLSLLEDDFGRFWFNSHTGIFWAWKKDLDDVADGKKPVLTCVHYGTEDGMLNVEGNGGNWPNSCKTRDGRLWFPTVKGVALVDPRAVAEDDKPPRSVIEETRADGRVLFGNAPNFERVSAPRKRTVAEVREESGAAGGASTREFRVPAGHRHTVHIEYTCTSMMASEKVRFRHRLAGRGTEWSEPGEQRFADFDGLAPGRYRFLVMACNAHGVWSEQPAEFKFVIEPEFYQTWVFYGFGALGFAGLAGGFGVYRRGVNRRISRLEKEKAVAAERERMARDLHDDLGGSLTQIALRLEIARSRFGRAEVLDHELAEMSSFARAAIENMGQIIWSANSRFDSVASLTAYIREYASKHLGEEIVFTSNIAVREESGVHLSPDFRRNLFYTVKEALTNIMKHARARNVTLQIEESTGGLSIEIADDGIGFAPVSGPSSRMGLESMRKRVDDLGGKITIDSAPGAGCRVRLTIPIR